MTEWNLHPFTGRPSEAVLDALRQLSVAAEEADGNPPLNDQTWVLLRSGDDPRRVSGVLAVLRGGPEHDDAEVVGAAVLTRGSGDPVLELVVRPEERGHGIGTELAAAALDALGDEPVSAWSHGDDAAASRLAQRHGFTPTRELWRMRRGAAGVPTPTLPEGVHIRAFRPGQDEAAWLAINAAAFASHPEQGSMSLEDLQAREAEEWFDAAGFLLAVDRQDTVLGFHWTKVHPAHRDARGGEHAAVGEVYAVGVSPAAQGQGLGRALTLAGMEHLAARGLRSIILYVDADNTAAVGLYRSLGFERWDGDVMYTRAMPSASQASEAH